MEVLGAISSVITIIDSASKLANYYGEVKNANQEVTRLQESLQNYKMTVEGLQSLLESQRDGRHLETSQKLRGALDTSRQQLQNITATLQESIDKKNQPSDSGGVRDKLRQKMSRLGLDKQSLEWPFQRKEINGIVNDLHQCQSILSAALQIDSTAAASLAHQRNVLSKLPIASGAAIDSQESERDPRCHPDTRKEILAGIFDWNEDPDGRCIFWLFGMAGTGKSTICRTVADQLRQENVPVATYLFKKGEGDRGTAKRFFTTLAAQIVHQVPGLASQVQDAIEKDPFIADRSKKEQFEMLILKPLEDCKSLPDLPRAITVVVDALDECEQDEDARAIIRLFSIAKESLTSVRLRFFVTSRPDIHIRLGFQSIGDRYADFALHEIPRPDIEGDIRRFLQWKLANIRDDFNTAAASDWLASNWPSDESLERLVGIAVPLFIFAATACRFIADINYGDPGERLEKILSLQRSHDLPRLHATYLPILDQLLLERTEYGWTRRTQEDEQHIIQTFRALVGPIVVLAEPLSRKSLACLLHTPQRTIDRQLSGLHSVLNIPKSELSPVKLLHLSFRDFLLNNANRDNNRFWIDEQETQATLGSHCLSLLSAPGALKNDICNLGQPGKSRFDLEPEEISRCIHPEVQYACRYWVSHMKQGQCRLRDDGEVHRFLAQHFLHWIEVLSLIGRASESVGMIDHLLGLLDKDNSTGLSSFLQDARRAALRDRGLWDERPLQIYHSTLVFLPQRSVIRKTFGDQYPSYLARQPRMDEDWDLHVQSLEIGKGGSPVGMFVFSPDSRLLCWASDKTTEVWDVVTGARIMQAPGVSDARVTFCSNGRSLALAGQSQHGISQVEVFDIATGCCVETVTTLGCYTKSMGMIAFSPDGKMLAAASMPDEDSEDDSEDENSDGDGDGDGESNGDGNSTGSKATAVIQLYNLETGDWGSTLHVMVEPEQMVMFSTADGIQLALQHSFHLTILDATTGSQIRELQLRIQKGPAFLHFPFAFSPDGRHLATSGRLINPETGADEEKLELWKRARTVRFSPDGCMLFNVQHAYHLTTLWDAQTGRRLGVFRNCTPAVPAISPDGSLLVTLSETRSSLNLWSLDSCRGDAELGSTVEESFSRIMAYPTRNRLVCFARSRSMGPAMIYDVETGDFIETIDACLGPVDHAALSSDANLLAFIVRQPMGPRNRSERACDKERYLGTIWDISAHKTVDRFDSTGTLAFSSDGTRLAAAGWPCIIIWELAKPGEYTGIDTYPSHLGLAPESVYESRTYPTQLAFSPDDLLLAAAFRDGRVSIWEATTGNHLNTLYHPHSNHFNTLYYPHGDLISCMIFLQTGKSLALVEGYTTQVSIWEVATGTCTMKVDLQGTTIEPHISAATGTSFTTHFGEFGYGAVPTCVSVITGQDVPVPFYPAYRQGLGISDDFGWILWNDQRILFLPFAYRPSNRRDFQILGTRLLLRILSKKVVSIEFLGNDSTLS